MKPHPMTYEISIAKSKRLAKARSEVARFRARAVAEALLDPKGCSRMDAREPWLSIFFIHPQPKP